MSIKDMPIAFRVDLHKELIVHGIVPSCLTCEHTDVEPKARMHAKIGLPQGELTCGKYNAKPPLQVVASGCVSWVQGIPF
jgi:hypothetical protein